MHKADCILKKIEDVLDKLFYFYGIAGLLLAVGSYALNIISWWVRGNRIAKSDDFAMIGLVWASYAGIGILFRCNGHCSIDFVVNLLPEKGRKILKIFQDVIIAIISAIAMYYSWKLAYKSIGKYLTISQISYFYVDIAITLGYAHLLLLTVVDSMRNVIQVIGWKKEEIAQ